MRISDWSSDVCSSDLDSQRIGQFGVGFYSSYIVADKVTVLSKRSDADGTRWESDGQGEFTIEPSFKLDRGTEVILHLREDDKEFLEPSRLSHLVRKYSDHIGLPIKQIGRASCRERGWQDGEI